ncbi:CbrC family protein [Chitinimonas lacunae]|uniref:CbrC family protein n=1 Tax=Chitinimonas lacunae TaxID=1963018 RepID=A0ABV8MU96_9NEIS
MSHDLPLFRYHPDPIATGAVEPSDSICQCCGQARGYLYTGSIYALEDLDHICPWCIADGSAAARFDASFIDDYPLLTAGMPAEVVTEVSRRTPGYLSWQQEAWLTHCHDACEFHGDASLADIRNASDATKAAWMADYRLDEEVWQRIEEGYQPGGNPAIYKFVCRHCQQILFAWDCS